MGAGTALQCIPIVAESRIPQQKSYLVALEGHTPQLSSYFPMLATTAPGSHLHRSAFGWWAHEPGTAVCGQWQGTGSWRAPWQSSLPCRRDKACWQRCCSRDKERIKSTLAQAVLKAQVPETGTMTETAAEDTCPLINFLGSTAEEEAKAGSKSRN